MLPSTFATSGPPSSPPPRLPEDCGDPGRTALARAGALLVDLADQATKLAGFLADHPSSKHLAGSLCRRSELTRQLGRRLAVSADPGSLATTALVNDSILSLDGVSLDVEHSAEMSFDVKVKNQIARSRLAVTTASCAIEDIRRLA